MKERIIYFAPIAAAFASGALATGAAVIALDAVGENPLKAAIPRENSDVSTPLSTSTEGCAISGHRSWCGHRAKRHDLHRDSDQLSNP